MTNSHLHEKKYRVCHGTIYYYTIHIFLHLGLKNMVFFYKRVIKWILLRHAGQKNPFFNPLIEKNRVRHLQNKFFSLVAQYTISYWRVIKCIILPPSPCEENSSISCNTEEKSLFSECEIDFFALQGTEKCNF